MYLALATDPSPLAGAGPDLSWLLTVVAVLLATILGVAWALRKVLAGAWKSRAGKRALRVVDVLPLGGRRQLAVVRCYDRTFALGLGDKEVALVAELDPDFIEAARPARPAASTEDRRNFMSLFDTARDRITERRAAGLRARTEDALARAEQGLPTPRGAEAREEGVVA